MRDRAWIALHLIAATLPACAALLRLPDAPLFGVEPHPAEPPTTLASWVADKVQKYVVDRFETKLGFRGVLVRTDNTLFYRTLGETKADAVVKRGRDGVLFIDDDLGYASKRAVDLPPRADIDELAALAGEAQRRLAAKGKKLVVVIAPSKTSLYADAIPSSWRRRGAQRSDVVVYEELREALKRNHVEFADGRAILSSDEAERQLLFPPSARHWSAVGACRVLRAGARELVPAECAYSWRSVDPLDPDVADFDLYRLTDVWHVGAPSAAVPVVDETRPQSASHLRTLFVGTSFLWALVAVARFQARSVTCFYYNSTVYDATGPTPRPIGPVDPSSAAWASYALDEDIYVLELFEGYVHAPPPRDFLHALLARL